MADVRKRVGENFRRARLQKGWSQEELGFRSGIHRTYISDLERGTRNPSLTLLHDLATTLEMELSELVRLANGSPPAANEGR
ncbi:MAG TPA: helix-turn-helix transcriptional regulator [Alphaproteobacteria bacterium]|nr:helix-turn-helix transcriptional regulator [Alphaproteobacteria bacterium]